MTEQTKDFEFALILEREPGETEGEAIAAQVPALVAIEGGAGLPTLAHVVVDDADDFAGAVARTVRQIEAAGVLVVGLAADDLVSIKEIAERTGRTRESVRLLAVGERGPGGFPAPVSAGQWALYPWTAVAEWFTAHYADQAYELDRQAAVADHLLRARHMARSEPSPDWAHILSA
jgi:hypothetical protein